MYYGSGSKAGKTDQWFSTILKKTSIVLIQTMTATDLSPSGPDGFEDAEFDALNLEEQAVEDKSFYACIFRNGAFHKTRFVNCLFEECEFVSCDLSAARFSSSRLPEVIFKQSKVTGINWTEMREPIQPPKLSFVDCVLNYSSFMDMNIKGVSFIDCVAHEVSFQGAQLNEAVFKNTDLAGAQFNHTDLRSADLSSAFNYLIHPGENRVRDAQFSFPEAQSLLVPFGILLV